MTSEESNEMVERKNADDATESEEAVSEEALDTQPAEEEGSAEETVSPQPAVSEDTSDDNQNPVAAESEQENCDEDPFSGERIQRILDIELPVNVSFGSTRRTLSEVLKLGPGALLELDRDADEPVILKVNNKVFAKGEIVDVDGYYGVQITEISSPAQRIASLGEQT